MQGGRWGQQSHLRAVTVNTEQQEFGMSREPPITLLSLLSVANKRHDQKQPEKVSIYFCLHTLGHPTPHLERSHPTLSEARKETCGRNLKAGTG